MTLPFGIKEGLILGNEASKYTIKGSQKSRIYLKQPLAPFQKVSRNLKNILNQRSLNITNINLCCSLLSPNPFSRKRLKVLEIVFVRF